MRLRRSVLASAALHGGALLALGALAASPRSPGEGAPRAYRIELARSEPVPELAPRPAPEPEPIPEPQDEPLEPELVPAELPEEPPPAPAPAEPPAPDASFELVDPFERVPMDAWAAPARERAAEAPAEAAAAPPPQPVSAAPPPRPFVPATPGEPEVLEDPSPSYPRAARRLGLEGSVKLRAAVRKDGTVREVSVVESSGHALLDDAARDKLYEWLFRPWRAGEPDERSYLKTFTFRMPG